MLEAEQGERDDAFRQKRCSPVAATIKKLTWWYECEPGGSRPSAASTVIPRATPLTRPVRRV